MTVAEKQQVTFPSTMLEDPEGFEQLRSDIYSETKHGTGDRAGLLTDLAAGMAIKGKLEDNIERKPTVLDALVHLDQVHDLEPNAEDSGIDYRFTLGPDGEVLEIGVVKHLPRDHEAIESARAMSSRVPSGPRQNRLSGRFGSTPPKRKVIHTTKLRFSGKVAH